MLSRLIKTAFILSIFASMANAKETSVTLMKEYHTMDPTRGLVTSNGFVFAARRGLVSEKAHFIEIYNENTLKLVKSLEIFHNVNGMESDGECLVLSYNSVGYTIIDACSDGFEFNTYRYKENFLPFNGTIIDDRKVAFFSPNQGLVIYENGMPIRAFGKKFTSVTSMKYFNDYLWVSTYGEMLRVSLKNGAVEKINVPKEDFDFGFVTPHAIGGQNYVLVSVGEDNRVEVIDADSGKFIEGFILGGEPSGIVTFGRCAAVTRAISKKLTILANFDGGFKELITWDISKAGDRLKKPTQIAISDDRERIFVRSSYPCPSCSVTQSSLYAVDDNYIALEKCEL